VSGGAEPARGPRGVFLQGGGALGAWQAGALEVLDAAGWRFDAVMGYSIGAVNGTALAFGRLAEALARWRVLDGRALKPRPRLRPFALCTLEPLTAFLDAARDEEAAKAALKAELTLVAACPATGRAVHARFTPGGKGGWDAPLLDYAAASCAVPMVFPAVSVRYRGRPMTLVDGGVPMPTPFELTPLAGCAEILILEMVRADERGRRDWAPWRWLDQGAREAGRELVDEGVTGLLNSDRPPVVRRLAPSRRLKPVMLDFRAAGLREMLALGAEDARAFLAAPDRWRVL
jgi:predicted acylesterase/phospholipase RssA